MRTEVSSSKKRKTILLRTGRRHFPGVRGRGSVGGSHVWNGSVRILLRFFRWCYGGVMIVSVVKERWVRKSHINLLAAAALVERMISLRFRNERSFSSSGQVGGATAWAFRQRHLVFDWVERVR